MNSPRVLVRRSVSAADKKEDKSIPVVGIPLAQRHPSARVVVTGTSAIAFSDRIVAMEAEYEEFKRLLQIDRTDLDTAQADQASVFLEVAERYVMAASIRDEARDTLARRDAELARDERRALGQAGEKVTEAIINDYVMLHPAHSALSVDYESCKRLADKWGAMQRSFEQRKSMLQELTGLFAAGYWNSGSVKPRASVQDAVAASIKEKQNALRRGTV